MSLMIRRTICLCLAGVVLGVFGCQGSVGSGQQTLAIATPTSPGPKPILAPTATPMTTPVSTLQPSPTPGVFVIAEALDPCGPSLRGYYGELHEHFLHWTGNDKHLIFDVEDTIWTMEVEGGWLQQVADADSDYQGFGRSSGYKFLYGFHADVLPDSSQIVYSTCEYLLDEPFTDQYGTTIYSEGYEIAAVNIDGSGRKRLTKNHRFDHYPVWSPDGTHIAFIANLGVQRAVDANYYEDQYQRNGVNKLAIMYSDAEDGVIRELWDTRKVALYPPVWSPDGQSLAFIENEGKHEPYKHILHTIRSNGSERNRIGETTAVPTWSPDSKELAFATFDEEDAVIYAVKPDGDGMRRLWSSGPDDASPPVTQVIWSPDGSEILFISDEIYVVDSDGGGLRRLAPNWSTDPSTRAAWSKDGSKIAVYYPGSQIIAMSSDGTDLRILAEVDELHR